MSFIKKSARSEVHIKLMQKEWFNLESAKN